MKLNDLDRYWRMSEEDLLELVGLIAHIITNQVTNMREYAPLSWTVTIAVTVHYPLTGAMIRCIIRIISLIPWRSQYTGHVDVRMISKTGGEM